jgi:hypothetical protein
MRLYPLNAPRTVHDHPEWGHFEADGEGGFDFPDEMSDELHSFHHRGKPLWENEDERSVRLHGDEVSRQRDPQALYAAVTDIANITRQLAGLQLGAAEPAAGEGGGAKPARRTAAAKS